MDARLTHSQISTAMRCPRRHQFAYVELVRPVETAKPLRMGTAIHVGLDARAAGNDEETSIAAALNAHAEHRRDDDAAFWVEQEIIAQMLIGYWKRYGVETETIIATEQAFTIPLVNPETDARSRTWVVSGKIDKIIQMPDSRLAIREHKTTSEDLSPDSLYWARLRLDLQISMYIMGARSLGYDVQTVEYDVLRKPTTEPKLLTVAQTKHLFATGEYKDGEIVYGMHNVQDGMVDGMQPETNGNRIRETIPMYGNRLAMILHAESDRYYARREIPRLAHDLKAAQEELWDHGRILADNYRLHRWPRNTSQCTLMGRCPYLDLCSAGWEPGDTLPEKYRVADSAHEELDGEAS